MNAKRNIVKALAACVSLALAGFVFAADTITLNVASGSITLEEALVKAGSSIDAITQGDGKSVTLKKTGKGTVVFNTVISGWTGDLLIEEGVVETQLASADVLGSSSSGAIYVSNGGTLYVNVAGLTTSYRYGVQRPLHISGDGAEGMIGAYVLNCTGCSGNELRAVCPKNLILDADATVGCMGDSWFIYDCSNTIDANKHKLTFKKEDAIVSKLPRFYLADLFVKNPSQIVMDGVHLRMRMNATNRDAKIDGGAEVVITLINGASLQYEDNNVGLRWTLVFEETAGDTVIAEGDRFTAGRQIRAWAGPVVLNRQITISDHTKNTDAARAGSYSFGSTISGPGSITMSLTDASLAQNRKLTLFLGGDVSVSSVNLENVTLYLNEDVEMTAPLKLEGEMAIDSCGWVLSARDVVKTGKGTLNVIAPVTGETLDVQGGKVVLANITGDDFRQKYAGLYAGRKSYWNGGNSGYLPWNEEPYTGFVTNEVRRIPPIFTETNNDSNWYIGWVQAKDNAYQTYDGFIWNDSNEPVTWTFINVLAAHWEMTIGDTKLVNNELRPATNGKPMDPVIANVVLQPGANAFRMRFGFQFASSGNAGCVATNGLSGVWNGKGVAYDTQARMSKNAADYTAFSTDENPPLFTTHSSFPNTFTFDTVTGSAGTELDLNGFDSTFGSVNGAIKIVNGSAKLKVTGQDAAVSVTAGNYVLSKAMDGSEKVAGLWYGETGDCNKYENVLINKDYMYIMSNSVDTALAPFFHVTTWPGEGVDWTKFEDPFWKAEVRRYKTWSGYIYNHEPTQVVWTVIDTMNAYAEIKVNGSVIMYQQNITDGRGKGGKKGTPPNNVSGAMARMTLNPGANLFQLRYYNRWSSADCWPGSVATKIGDNELVGWSEGNGLMFDRLGRDSYNIADYEPMFDTGDGTLFTYEEFKPATIASVTAQPGSVIDLQGETRYTATLSGPVQIVNGKLVVMSSWTLTAQEVMSEEAAASGIELAENAVFTMSATEIAALKGKKAENGFLIGKNWTGKAPKLSDEMKKAGWIIKVCSSELRLVRATLMIVVR